MDEQILNAIYEGYVKWMKETKGNKTKGYMTCCSKAEFKLMALYLCESFIILMGNE